MRKLTKSMWLRRVSPLSLAGALMFPLALHSAETSPGMTSKQMKVYQEGKKTKETYLAEIENKRRNAMLAAGSGKYAEALRELEDCEKKLKKATGDLAAERLEIIQDNIKRLKKVWCSEIMRDARKLAAQKKFDDAAAKAHSALALAEDNDYVISFIDECKKHSKGEDFRKSTAMQKIAPDYKDKAKRVDTALREAKVLFRNKRYEAACKRLEDVLRDDPFNVEAIDMLALSYDRLYKVGVNRSIESNKHFLAQNVWEWAEPLPTATTESLISDGGTIRKTEYVDLNTRMEKIFFPTFKFNNTPLAKVIEYLNDKSSDYDPDKRGVTIIDRLPSEGKNKRVTMELGKMPLADILRYLSMETGYAYTFNKGNVIFGQVDNLTVDSFPINGAIIAEIIDALTVKPTGSGMKSGEESGGDAPEDEEAPVIDASAEVNSNESAGTSASSGDTEEQIEKRNAALKNYFEERGISFAEGTSIYYNDVEELMEVRNTPENLRRIGELLRQLNALKQPMVMVEVKMIELTDTNLNELGFEWMFSANGNSGWNMGTVSPLRNSTDPKLIKDMKIFPNFGEKLFGKNTNVNLNLSVNAVAQNRSAEVLASPRILTESAPKEPAMIKMVEKTYFVTEWEEPEIESDGLNTSIDTTEPEWDDEARDLGVTFTIQPVVQADNYTILLKKINPVFLTHVKNHDHVISYETRIQGNGRDETRTQTFNLSMPEFSRREITTNISLYDGETVLIGGMVDNVTLERDDKWPILGDIPLVGRLFQDKMSNVTNRTMLIFITARLVNPDGSPVRQPRDNSVINFNR